MVAEAVTGFVSGSLALVSDAGHMFTDAAAIAVALFAMWIAERDSSPERTFGYYRTEVLAALANVLALWLIVGWIFFEAYHRFRGVEDIDVDAGPVLIVGIGGLVINLVVAGILHASSQENLNVQGAFWHVVADLLGSVGVVISAVLILAFDWTIADPILSVVIGLLVLVSSWNLVRRIFHVLLEGTPEHIDVYKLCSDIEELEGVTVVHDVHIWTITSGNEAFTAHVLVDPSYDGDVDELLTRIQGITHDDFGIGHATIQVEKSLKGCVENHHVGHLLAHSSSERERTVAADRAT